MKPNGKEILATLINLLADQEGVKITFEIEQKGNKNDGKRLDD
jgi:hypothetical protein